MPSTAHKLRAEMSAESVYFVGFALGGRIGGQSETGERRKVGPEW